MALLTESGYDLETESGLVLNRESFVKRLGRKKILYFPEVKHFEQTIKMRGDTRLPQSDQVITITAKTGQETTGTLQYKGTVRLIKESVQVVGTNKKRTNDISGKMIGSKVRPIKESLVIEGKKNYDELIKAIEMLEI
jgi:hypothetical protein|tara:strand:+ start:398 stop:811 length:414 start_codon:yes stop_codon:yes gene_type:complete